MTLERKRKGYVVYPVNKKAQAVIERLIAPLVGQRQATKYDKAPGCFMALCVERIGPGLYSFAHYGEQNGDAMRDPDIVLWKGPDGRYYPASYRNDYLGVYGEAIVFDGTTPRQFDPRKQRSIALFVADWTENLKSQQGI